VDSSQSQCNGEPQALDYTQTPSSTLDVYRSHLSGLDQLMEQTPPEEMIVFTSLATTPRAGDMNTPVESISLTSENVFLLQTYVRTVATWMDLFDHSCTYQLKIPQLVLTSPLVFHCVCAFTASHLALSNPILNSAWKLEGVKHYGIALRLLYDSLSVPFCEDALTGSMLLLSYEIQGAIRSVDYRRHFLGLNILIKSHGITAQSSGTDLANFWIYCRHEIAVALANERPLMMDPEEWKVAWEDGESREDVLGNHVLWILARVINLIFGPDGTTQAGKEKRNAFIHELEVWRASLSDTFVGVPYGEEDEDGFRKVYFTVTAAAAAAFWYHITLVLLYTEPALQDESYIPLIQDQATRIINITISDFPAALKVFSTHGLYYG
jgi:hypothetical protein